MAIQRNIAIKVSKSDDRSNGAKVSRFGMDNIVFNKVLLCLYQLDVDRL